MLDRFKNNIIILDGATGTQMQKLGMPTGVCPEKWVIENKELLMELQKEYIEAGSNIIYTFTFGANPIKLSEFNLENETYEINKELANITKELAGKNILVAGGIAPTGKTIEPAGDFSFEEIVDAYKLQVKGLVDGGVDLFIIETMMDIQEARAAVIAIKETSDKPFMVSMTFEETGKTLIGTDPITALITLQSLGAIAVGCNCSTGPKPMLKLIEQMAPYAKVPLLVKPNAGVPRLIEGKTIFKMQPDEFGSYAPLFVEAGASILGGCCGTGPMHILEIKKRTEKLKRKFISNKKSISVVTSHTKTVFTGGNYPISLIGEKINPTGKKELRETLKKGIMTKVREFAIEQTKNGADLLDVNISVAGTDQKKNMVRAIKEIISVSNCPLCIDSTLPDVVEASLRIYPGRALVNSISYEKENFEKLLRITKKYGAAFILLPLDDEGLPKTLKDKHDIILNILNKAKEYGFSKEDIVVDALVMTVSSNQKSAIETLETIAFCTNELKIASNIGLSNISFGMPHRDNINSAFLAMAALKGLSMLIGNPSSENIINMKYSADVLTGKDSDSNKYIERYGIKKEKDVLIDSDIPKTVGGLVFDAIVQGDRQNITSLVNRAIEEKYTPDTLVNKYMIPAIEEVGRLYDLQKYYLPQLIAGSQAMQKAFKIIEPLLVDNKGNKKEKIKIIIATVKGDVHDIGKNIVKLMLKNNGFEVIDLGKNVDSQVIVDRSIAEGAKIIALSALMTTTMGRMKEVISLLKKKGSKILVIIGGAAVTKEYAKEIGADGYSKDANEAVKIVKNLIKNNGKN